MELLYHHSNCDESPFGGAVADICEQGKAWVASPYIDLWILRAIAKSSEDFRVLTDLRAWSSMYGKYTVTNEIHGILRELTGCIRDLSGLHAKLVLGRSQAYLGSANLTRSGLTNNQELGVIIRDQRQLEELQKWFERAWQDASESSTADIEGFLVAGSNDGGEHRDPPLEQRDSGSVNATQGVLPNFFDTHVRESSEPESDALTTTKAWARFTERLSEAPGRWWAERFFSLLEKLLGATGLESDDPRLVTTVPKTYDRIGVSINNRFVLTGMWQGGSDLGFMVGPDFELPDELKGRVVYPGYGYEPHSKELDGKTPRFLAFEITRRTKIPSELIDDWLSFAAREKTYRSGSMHQRFHEPLVCSVTKNLELRELLFEKAFGEEVDA